MVLAKYEIVAIVFIFIKILTLFWLLHCGIKLFCRNQFSTVHIVTVITTLIEKIQDIIDRALFQMTVLALKN